MNYEGFRVGAKLRELRKNKNIKIAEMAELTGLSVETINKVERGNRSMTLKTMLKFAEVLQTDPNTLLGLYWEDGSDLIEMRLHKLPSAQREFLTRIFLFMLEQAELQQVA
ncbi:Helix-turn-helix domain-containing protein [Lachnospiraceae bacterium XBB1006]|nr:Helix-turn-helix domain-containing protein [Lachnospiraceae bacterium XBB1006]